MHLNKYLHDFEICCTQGARLEERKNDDLQQATPQDHPIILFLCQNPNT